MRTYSLPAAVIVSFALVGCGPKAEPKVRVSGRLLDNGQPFTADSAKLKLPKGTSLPPGVQPLQVMFIPVETGETYIATVTDASAGKFELTGSDGKGVKPGKYKVSVQVNTGPGTPDALGGKFSPEKTTITREVREGEELVIDLAQFKKAGK